MLFYKTNVLKSTMNQDTLTTSVNKRPKENERGKNVKCTSSKMSTRIHRRLTNKESAGVHYGNESDSRLS